MDRLTNGYRILVLGGYGNFGKRICASLAQMNIHLIVAGRSLTKASEYCERLRTEYTGLKIEPAKIDINHPELANQLKGQNPNLVIHTCGPFQGQNYRVPKACLAIGAHYIDLADDRRFVCDIEQLNQEARNKGLLLVSGASSVPGLSSTVIDHFSREFTSLESIDYAIAPGNKLERGFATIKAILSYTGQSFESWKNGQWQQVYGWMDSSKIKLCQPVGTRRVANVNVPDLELFPTRYAPVQTVNFKAGLELGALHNAMAFMAWCAKNNLIKNWAPFTGFALSMSNRLSGLGTDIGGMVVKLTGTDLNSSQTKRTTWTLIAENGVGPYIPTIPAILLAKKLATGNLTTRGALPCMGLFSLDEFMGFAKDWGIYQHIT